LWEHGGWGAGSAQLAAKVIEAYVDKQRRLEHNLAAKALTKNEAYPMTAAQRGSQAATDQLQHP